MRLTILNLYSRIPTTLKGGNKGIQGKGWYNYKRYHRGVKAIPITLYYPVVSRFT